MKYLAILVLLLTPAMAQQNGTVVYMDPCMVIQSFGAHHPNDTDYVAAVKAMSAYVRKTMANSALDCLADKKATRNQLRESGSILYFINDANQYDAQKALLAAAEKRANDVAVAREAGVQETLAAVNPSIRQERAQYQQLQSSYDSLASRLASRPQSEIISVPTYVPTYTVPEYEPPVHPQRCVATSTPLGNSVVTGVNCYPY